MAGTLKIRLQAALTNGEHSESFANGSSESSFVQTNQGAYSSVVSVGTSEEDLSVGDVGTLGWLFLKNLDSSNYVTYGPKSSGSMVAFGRIEPGEVVMLRLSPGITLRWQANTSAVKVKTLLLED